MQDPPIADWEDETGHGHRLIEWFVAAREDGMSLEQLRDALRPALRTMTDTQRQTLRVLAERRIEGPYDQESDITFGDAMAGEW